MYSESAENRDSNFEISAEPKENCVIQVCRYLYGDTDLVKLAFILCSQILQIFLGVFDGTVV